MGGTRARSRIKGAGGEELIYPNVEIGEGTVIQEGAIVGEPPRGVKPGEMKTTIGAGGVIRSGTVIYAGAVIGDRFNSGHGALIREDNIIGDDCSVGTNAVLEAVESGGSGERVPSGCFFTETTTDTARFYAARVVGRGRQGASGWAPRPISSWVAMWRDSRTSSRPTAKPSIRADSTRECPHSSSACALWA